MTKSVLIATTLFAIAPAFAATQTALTQNLLSQNQSQSRYIVTFKNDHSGKNSKSRFSAPSASQLIQQHGGKVKHNLHSIKAIAAELTPAQIKQLKNNPQVARIEADPPRYAQAASAPYGISMVQADLVSDSASGNQKVCVIDTGYDINHEDLMNGANVTGEVSNTLTAPVDLADWSTDTYGHGTHVAGTIASLNNSVGAEGVAPNGLINLHIVKVIHKANYWQYWGSDVIDAVQKCQAAGATVINMSMAGATPSVAEEAAIDAAYNSGAILVGASGNRGNNDYYYPAAYDSVISVGAVDQTGDAWMYTQTNDKIELVAPGVGVESTLPNNRYGFMDGTSAAAPFVSGVAALVWSHHPECSNQQIRDVLQQTAQDKGAAGRDDVYGHGLIQAKAALDAIDANGCGGEGGSGEGSGGSTEIPVTGFEDLTWTLSASHPEQDTCGGIRQSNFDPNLYYVRTGATTAVNDLEVPSGYHWVSKSEYTDLYNASTVPSKNTAVFIYFKQCGLSVHPTLNGEYQHVFLLKDGGTTGIKDSHYEYHGAVPANQEFDIAEVNLAGYVLYKDN